MIGRVSCARPAVVGASLVLAACGGVRPAVSDAGEGAARITTLFWVLTAVGTLAFLIYCAGLAYGLFHRRPAERPTPTPERDRTATRWIVWLGAVVPAFVLVPALFYTLYTQDALDPRNRPADLVIEVVGKRWWWDVRYLDSVPSRVFTTANELHVPVGKRVQLRLSSSDVIHSFWVPELQGKTDLIPGRRNITWIQADRAGVFGGQCAEYCGMQHANMGLLVIAQPPEEFEAWAAAQRQSAATPRDSLARYGRATFEQSACALCHAVRGTSAGGNVGPDLTHVASRRTLAAATIPNTPGYLGGWIANPQAIKPGNLMPKVPMSPTEFRAILHYLRTLE